MYSRMEHHGASDASESSDGALGDTIMMMTSGAGEVVDLLKFSEMAREISGGEG